MLTGRSAVALPFALLALLGWGCGPPPPVPAEAEAEDFLEADHLFLASVLPRRMGWLAAALIALALVRSISTLFPRVEAAGSPDSGLPKCAEPSERFRWRTFYGARGSLGADA